MVSLRLLIIAILSQWCCGVRAQHIGLQAGYLMGWGASVVPSDYYTSSGAEWKAPGFTLGGWYEASDTGSHFRLEAFMEQQHWTEDFTRLTYPNQYSTEVRVGTADMRLHLIRFEGAWVLPIGDHLRFTPGIDLGVLLTANAQVKGDTYMSYGPPSPSSPSGTHVASFDTTGSYMDQLNPYSLGLRLGFSYVIRRQWEIGMVGLATFSPVNPYHSDETLRPRYLRFTLGRRLFSIRTKSGS